MGTMEPPPGGVSPYRTPRAEVSGPPPPPGSTERKRSGCLGIWLSLTFVGSIGLLLLFVFGADFIRRTNPTLPPWSIPVGIVQSILGFVFALAMWRWKKWGAYGAIGLAVLGVFINLAAGQGGLQSLTGFVSIGILVLLLRPHWAMMED